MTELSLESPPLLVLPTHPLDEAHAALGRALASVSEAQDLEWVSAAAGVYRSEIAVIEVRVRKLMVAVDWCRDDWQAARSFAWGKGQL